METKSQHVDISVMKVKPPEEFEKWWNEVGSGITPFPEDDMEGHAERVAREYAIHIENRTKPIGE